MCFISNSNITTFIPTSKNVANVATTYHQSHDINDVNCNFKDGFPSYKDKCVSRIVYSGHFSHGLVKSIIFIHVS
jgi:hypothetical protein